MGETGARRIALAFALVLSAISGFVLLSMPDASAVVTSSTRSVTYSPSSPTTGFSVTFPFLDASWLKVTKTTIATGVAVVLTQGVDYTVQIPRAGSNGVVTTTSSVTSTHTLKIERVVPLTQETAFRNQGSFRAAAHEDALDKLTMALQQVQSGLASTIAQADIDSSIATHAALADAHTVYVKTLGRSGGQHARGGTAAGESMQISSTTNATKGSVSLGSGGNELYVDDVNNRVGVLNSSPTVALDVTGAALVSTSVTTPIAYGGSASGGDVTINSTSHATKGNVYFGTLGTYDDVNERLGIGTITPSVALEVIGDTGLGTITCDTDVGYGSTLAIDEYEVAHISSEVDAEFTVYSSSALGVVATAAGINIYGDAHATRSGDIQVVGDLIRLSPVFGSSASSAYADLDSSGLRIMQGALQQWLHEQQTAAIAETVTAPDDCGDIFYASTDNTVVQLPDAAAANKGCEITVFNSGADAAALVSISPHSSDTIEGSCIGTTGAGAATLINFTGTANKDIQNTKATAQKGDVAKIVSDGTSAWYVLSCMGQWASEP